MSSIKEVKTRIQGVKETQKITDAMYLISSTKMRKIKNELDRTRPYFTALQKEVERIFSYVDEENNKYFYPKDKNKVENGTYGLLVITADKGLAGAYNHNIIAETLKKLKSHKDCKLFVVGAYGRRYFETHNIKIERSFLYTAQNPSFYRAREICDEMKGMYDSGEISAIEIIYTDFNRGIEQVRTAQLLPFDRSKFAKKGTKGKEFEFVPSAIEVLEHIIPSYIAGFIYSALVDSFCAEQNARMVAMDSASRNADKLIDELTLTYNHLRQSAITQEITEISASAKNQLAIKKKKEQAYDR
ncbi:MAG: ATP synthase F1 subunit gamma [Clostridia bacterium]|nr:ATP synthase F1 subunit gamma [Clostridia bacterium]